MHVNKPLWDIWYHQRFRNNQERRINAVFPLEIKQTVIGMRRSQLLENKESINKIWVVRASKGNFDTISRKQINAIKHVNNSLVFIRQTHRYIKAW